MVNAFPEQSAQTLEAIKAAYDAVCAQISGGAITPELLNERTTLLDQYTRARRPGVVMGSEPPRLIGMRDPVSD